MNSKEESVNSGHLGRCSGDVSTRPELGNFFGVSSVVSWCITSRWEESLALFEGAVVRAWLSIVRTRFRMSEEILPRYFLSHTQYEISLETPSERFDLLPRNARGLPAAL